MPVCAESSGRRAMIGFARITPGRKPRTAIPQYIKGLWTKHNFGLARLSAGIESRAKRQTATGRGLVGSDLKDPGRVLTLRQHEELERTDIARPRWQLGSIHGIGR